MVDDFKIPRIFDDDLSSSRPCFVPANGALFVVCLFFVVVVVVVERRAVAVELLLYSSSSSLSSSSSSSSSSLSSSSGSYREPLPSVYGADEELLNSLLFVSSSSSTH